VSKSSKHPQAKRTNRPARERAAGLILRFSADHLWVRVDGDRAQLGLSDHGQRLLGEIVAAELPLIGERLERGEQFAEMESTRTVHELIAPLSGTVTAVNTDLDGSPALVNEDPYQDGWLIEVAPNDERELDDLLAAEEYEALLEREHPNE
jgi:glycine cleavage system H protein